MSQSPENQPPTDISLDMDMHYKACWIPAGGAADVAYRLVEESPKMRQAPLLVHDYHGTPTVLTYVKGLKESKSKDYNEPEQPSLILTTDPDKKPRICAKLQNGVVVQVAAFERRDDDRCNFIQLGQEYSDDTYIFSPADHTRLDYVQAILELLKDRATDQQVALLQTFAEDEAKKLPSETIDDYKNKLLQERLLQACSERYAVRRPDTLIADTTDARTCTIEELLRFSSRDVAMPDGRLANIVVYQEVIRKDNIGALAIRERVRRTKLGDVTFGVRLESGVVVPMYVFSSEGEQLQSTQGDVATDTERDVVMRYLKKREKDHPVITDSLMFSQAHITLNNKNINQSYDQLKQFASGKAVDPSEQRKRELEFLAARLLGRERESIEAAKEHGETGVQIARLCAHFDNFESTEEFAAHLRKFIGTQTLSSELSWYIQEHVKRTQFEAALQKEPQRQFVRQPAVQEKVTEILGAHNPELDLLKERLAEIFDPNEPMLTGKYIDYPFSFGKADVTVQAQVSMIGNTYKLHVSVIPDGLHGKGETQDYQLEIHLAEPNGIKSSFATALADILTVVKPPKRSWVQAKKRLARRALGIEQTLL